MKPHK